MDLGIMTEPHLGGSYDDLLAAASWAESAGLTAFARCDHLYSGREPRPEVTEALTTLAGLARETTRIELTVLVAPITWHHPAILAKAAATIDQMSGGRFRLGLGTGWMELEHDVFGIPFPPSAERWERLEEALQYLRAAIGEDRARFSGRHYRIDAEVRPRPASLPLIVGGSGPRRTPTLAGTYADEYNHFTASAETLSPKISLVREAAERAGRDPSGIRMSVMGPVLAGSDDADYRRRLTDAARARDRDPEDLAAALTRSGVPHGPVEQVLSHLAAWAEVGVDLFYVQHLDLSDLSPLQEQIELIR